MEASTFVAGVCCGGLAMALFFVFLKHTEKRP
jgi:hypothetical protein